VAFATLPIVLSVVLAELAIGGSFVMWLVDRGGRAPSGFLKLVAFVDAGAIAAALAIVPTFPGGDLAERAGVDTGPLSAFGQALVLVTILMVIQLVTTFLPVRGLRLAAGLVTFLAGIAALGVVAIAAWWTAGMNTQSSTGLLYVALGCAFAGEVSARVIFFLTGVPI
jgi:hypothetical protein